MDAFEDPPEEDVLPLRDRMPDYLAVFGIGLAACVAVGVVIWWISDVKLASSVGYTVILYGVVLALAGGATGGGYTSLGMGAVGAMFGSQRTDEAAEGGKVRIDPQERLRQGLRPEANPRAFWQVIAAVVYVALGLWIVVIGS